MWVAMALEQAVKPRSDLTNDDIKCCHVQLGLAARKVVVKHTLGHLCLSQQLADADTVEASRARRIEHRADQSFAGTLLWVGGPGGGHVVN